MSTRSPLITLLAAGLFVAVSAAAYPRQAAYAGCGGPNDPDPCPEGGGEPEKKNRPPVEYPSFTPTATETPTATSTPLPSATPTATAVPSATPKPRAKGFFRRDPCENQVLARGIGLLMSAVGVSLSARNWRRTSGPNTPKAPRLYDSGRSSFDPDGEEYEEGGHFEWDPWSPLGRWVPPLRRIVRTPEGLTAFGGLALTTVSTALILLGGPC